MDELSEDARKLIARAMSQDEPPAGAEDESWGMVISRADRSMVAASRASVVPIASNPAPRWLGAAVLSAALLVVVGLGTWVVSSGPPPEPGEPAGHAGVAARPDKAQPARHHAGTPGQPPAPAPAATPSGGAVALDDAEAAMLDDDGTRALALLEQHAQQAPMDEPQRRLALRVRTLCVLGRTADARSEAVAFLERHPKSQWAADVRASCGGTR